MKAYPVGAGESITASQARWGGILLVARKWGVITKYESELSEDSMTNLGAMLLLMPSALRLKTSAGSSATGPRPTTGSPG